MLIDETPRSAEEMRPYHRQQLLWLAVRGAKRHLNTHKQDLYAIGARLNDTVNPAFEDEVISLDRRVKDITKHIAGWEEVIKEGMAWLHEWERANGLELSKEEDL